MSSTHHSAVLLIILLAAGVALACIEQVWTRRAGLAVYHRSQFLSDLGCAALRLPAELLVKLAFVALYQKLQAQLEIRVLALDHVSTWLVGFLAFELTFYWTHRLSHHVPLLWAVHAVHHQSNDFNLVAGARLGMLAPTLNYPFFLILSVLGLPIEVFVGTLYFSGSWQFLLHTRCWSGPTFLRLVVNTPSQHRTHHSTDKRLGNANFAGVLIGLDRLFGSYAEGGSTLPVGLNPPLSPRGPLAANLLPLREAWRATAARPGVWRRLLALVGVGGAAGTKPAPEHVLGMDHGART